MIPKRITIHCTATENGKPVPAKTIDLWHKLRGFDRIGYHLVIQPSGEVERGRGLNEVGAHVAGDNEDNLGIVLCGFDRFTVSQFISLRSQLDAICQIYNIPPWMIHTHAQFESARTQGKTCPNVPINVLLSWYIGHHEKALVPYLLAESKL